MVLGASSLGCDNSYQVCLTSSCGVEPLRFFPNVCEIKFNRVLDDISDVKIKIGISDENNCSDFIDFVCLGRHYITVKRNGIVEWKGPALRVEYDEDGRIVFSGSDPMWWTTKRESLEPQLVFYNEPLDLFEDQILSPLNDLSDCSQDFTPACFSNICRVGGGDPGRWAINSPKHSNLDLRLEDFADTFLDYTVVGDSLLYGYLEVPVPVERRQATPVLTDKDWCGPPRIVKDINNLATTVVANGKDEQFAIAENCYSKHGAHQVVVSRTQLAGADLLQQSADVYLDHNDDAIEYIENSRGSQLSPNVLWDLPRMVPGMLVYVKTDKYGIKIDRLFRLHEVNVSYTPKGEKVKISLEPEGAQL